MEPVVAKRLGRETGILKQTDARSERGDMAEGVAVGRREAPVAITERAAQQIRKVFERQGQPGAALRLGVKGGGCSGLSYFMAPESEPTEKDRVYDIGGLRVCIDLKSLLFLRGTVVDYTAENLMGGGFTFENPNAARSCGCGSSFTPKQA